MLSEDRMNQQKAMEGALVFYMPDFKLPWSPAAGVHPGYVVRPNTNLSGGRLTSKTETTQPAFRSSFCQHLPARSDHRPARTSVLRRGPTPGRVDELIVLPLLTMLLFESGSATEHYLINLGVLLLI